MKHQEKRELALQSRIAVFEERHNLARQTSGGDKLVPMMHKPGSQNRKKGYAARSPRTN